MNIDESALLQVNDSVQPNEKVYLRILLAAKMSLNRSRWDKIDETKICSTLNAASLGMTCDAAELCDSEMTYKTFEAACTLTEPYVVADLSRQINGLTGKLDLVDSSACKIYRAKL